MAKLVIMKESKEVWRCILVRDESIILPDKIFRLPDRIFRRITHIRHIEGSNLSWYCYNKEPFESRMRKMQEKADAFWKAENKRQKLLKLPWYKQIFI